ncbi:hypothetical protein Bbelb_308290 [Branchiostoma belcheri]|nr:hypothetical protein Bbelb_308290 [Branchiostoma belcheri]
MSFALATCTGVTPTTGTAGRPNTPPSSETASNARQRTEKPANFYISTAAHFQNINIPLSVTSPRTVHTYRSMAETINHGGQARGPRYRPAPSAIPGTSTRQRRTEQGYLPWGGEACPGAGCGAGRRVEPARAADMSDVSPFIHSSRVRAGVSDAARQMVQRGRSQIRED